MNTLPGYILAVILPLFFLWLIYRLDFYQTGQFRIIFLAFVWGAIAYFLAGFFNSWLYNRGIFEWDQIVRFTAPVAEEILKGLFLLYLVSRPQFTYSVDGAVYGFAAGIGFAIFENFQYILEHLDVATMLAVQRVFSTNLVHAADSAMIGVALGIFRLERSKTRWGIVFLGLSLAIGWHMFFNNMISRGTYLSVAIGAGLTGALFITLSIRRGLNQAEQWIRDRLGMEDRVTSGEAAMVNRLKNLDEILLPVVERFGPETASRVEEFLFIQARIGIKRKTTDNLDEKLRRAVNAEIEKMKAEMDEIRRELGTYVMLFVRGAYPEDVIDVWGQLQDKVKASSEASGGQKGGGLWSSLDDRVRSTSHSNQEE
jgi:RsiW-degrading membrane proteinase PrsW (M82 family)